MRGKWCCLFLLSKSFWEILFALFLCHLFLLYNAISCFLRAVAENIHFNLHSWHKFCHLESLCYRASYTSLWRFFLLAGSELPNTHKTRKLQAGLFPAIYLEIHAKPSGLHSKPEVSFFLVKLQGKTEAFHFQRSCSGCKRVISFTQGDPRVRRDWLNLVGSCWSTRDFAWRILLVNRWPEALLSALF